MRVENDGGGAQPTDLADKLNAGMQAALRVFNVAWDAPERNIIEAAPRIAELLNKLDNRDIFRSNA